MTDKENMFLKGENFLEENKYLQAIQIFKSLLAVPEFKRKSLIKLTEIYDAQNQVGAAVNHFENYLSENSDDENVRAFYAQFLIKHKKYSGAHDVLSGISIESRPEKNFLIGIVNYYLADYDISILNFNDFIENNKHSDLLPEAYLYQAKCYLKTNELELSLKNVKKSEELSSQNYEVFLTLAMIYYFKEMYFHSLENIKKSRILNPTEIKNYEWAGKTYFKLAEYDKARKELEVTIEMGKPNSETYSLLGLVCIKLNDNNSAKKYFKSALEYEPNNKIAIRGLADCK